MAPSSQDRGQWSSKLGFVLAAAGSAVGLGNIWKFPSEVAENGGAAFILIYLMCCFLVGFPVMVAELSIGRKTKKNPVGAFKALSANPIAPLIGFWGVLCGVMILSFYNVIAGFALSFVLEEIFFFAGNAELANWFGTLDGGFKVALFSGIFMIFTITVVTGGISGGIERATKTMMPLLIGILFLMIIYVATQEGSGEGFSVYLKPDFSKLDVGLFFQAMGQAFFSLSLGMGALITYGSYLSKKQNIAEAAAFVTLADVGIAFTAGLLIIPAMYVAQANGIGIFDANGALISSTNLVFDVLPALFHQMATSVGAIFGITFFLLLSMAALTSTISLLEVPTSYAIDELKLTRKKAATLIGSGIGLISIIISFNMNLIGTFGTLFNDIGLPLGGFLICIFLGYVWKTENALLEIEEGYPDVQNKPFGKIWPIFIRFICPLLIIIVFVVTIANILGI